MVSKEKINYIITHITEQYNYKCRDGTRGSGGVIYGQGEKPVYELNDSGLTDDLDLLNRIADDMAKRWGLEVSVDENGKREISKSKFSLWDDQHKTLIRLNKILKHQDWIDFTNNGKGNYDLDDVLRYYTEMDDFGKTRASALIFETNRGASMNRLYNGTYGLENTVEISAMCYGRNRGTDVPSEFHLKQVMAHEFGHASERVLTRGDVEVLRKSCVGKNKFTGANLNSAEHKRFKELLGFGSFRGKANAISYSKEYEEAMRSNNVVFASSYSKKKHNYGITGKCEDFAEVMSAVSYRNTNDKSNFRIEYPGGKVVGYDEFVRDHQGTFNLVCDYVDGKISHSDLHDPVSNNKFS